MKSLKEVKFINFSFTSNRSFNFEKNNKFDFAIKKLVEEHKLVTLLGLDLNIFFIKILKSVFLIKIQGLKYFLPENLGTHLM